MIVQKHCKVCHSAFLCKEEDDKELCRYCESLIPPSKASKRKADSISDKGTKLDFIASKSNIGLIGSWNNYGLGVLTKELARILSARANVFIYSFTSGTDSNDCQYNISSVSSREYLKPRSIINWIKANSISLVIILEPVTKPIWDIVVSLKELNIIVYGLVMIEIARRNELEYFKLLDKVLCPNRTSYNILAKKGLTNLVYIGWGIDLDKFKPDKANRDYILLFHNAGHYGTDFRKGTIETVLAFDRASKVSNGKLKLHLHTQLPIELLPSNIVKIIDSNSDIILTNGNVSYEQIAKWTNEADIAVLPSKYEGVGVSLLESLASGTPVITTNHYPMNEYIIDGYNGLLCDVEYHPIKANPSPLLDGCTANIDSLAKLMLKCLNLDIKSMSNNARQYAESNLDVKLVMDRLFKALPKSVLFIGQFYYPFKGGAERSIHECLRILREEGHLVYSAVINTNIKLDELLVIDGIVTFKVLNDYDYILSKAKLVNPDIIFTQLNASYLAYKVAEQLNKPLVFFTRSFYEHICSSIMTCNKEPLTCDTPCIANQSTSEVLRYASVLVANSEYSKSVFTRHFNISKPFIVIYPIIDKSKYTVKAESAREYILLVKPVLPKGLELFVSLAKLFPNEQFVMVGETNRTYVKQILSEVPNLKYMDKSDNMVYIYSKAKVVLIPSLIPEGFCRVAPEAMCAGVPVIASNLGGLKESAGEASILIDDYKNVNAWAEALSRLLADENLRNNLIQKGYSHIDKFTVESQREKVLKLIGGV